MKIWHIFRKDCTLLWRFAICVGALHVAMMAAGLRIGRFNGPRIGTGLVSEQRFSEGVLSFGFFLPSIALIASAFLIIAIVQQDAIPGARQDWLVRPIARRDLLLAKILSVLILAQGPIFLADMIAAVLTGFPLSQAVSASLGRTAYLWFSVSLPVLAFASLTRNLMEAIVGATAVIALVSLGPLRWPGRPLYLPFGLAGVNWMNEFVRLVFALLGAGAILWVQYRWRQTTLARCLMAAIILLSLLVPPVPWQTALAIQQRLSPNPGAGNSIEAQFIPDRSALEDRPVGPSGDPGLGDVFVTVPVGFTGIPQQSVLAADAARIRIAAPGGTTESFPTPMIFRVWNERPGEGEKPISYTVRIRNDMFRRISDQPVRLEIDYNLTLLRQVESQSLPATGGNSRSRILGWCGTRVDAAQWDVLFGCIEAGSPPACVSFVLEHRPSGARNPRVSACGVDYAPFRMRYGSEVLSRFTERLPFHNSSEPDSYPVRGPMLAESVVTARAYRVEDHFTRQLTIPEIRLKEWVQ